MQIHLQLYDPHWRQYTDAVLPCQLKYDAIIKLETVNEDVPYAMQQLWKLDKSSIK